MTKMVELPNGDWVVPEYIAMVEVAEGLPAEPDIRDEAIPPRVILHLPNHDRRILYCGTLEEARALRSEVMQTLNKEE